MNETVYSLFTLNISGTRFYYCTARELTYAGKTWRKLDTTMPTVVQRGDTGAQTAGLVLANINFTTGQAIVGGGLRQVFPRQLVKIYDGYGISGNSPVTVKLVFTGYVDRASAVDTWIMLDCVGSNSATNYYPKHKITARDFDFLVEPGTVFVYNNENYVFEEQR